MDYYHDWSYDFDNHSKLYNIFKQIEERIIQKFKVLRIINKITIEVDGWYWNRKNGTIVIPTEFLNPKKYKINLSEKKLNDLILNKYIEIGEVELIDENKQMVAQVFYKGKNIIEYFRITEL